jgi:hypothetical protein
MTLKEKFINLYPHQTEQYLDYEEAEECEKIADDFAIGFGAYLDEYLQTTLKNKTIKELLEIYKKEKEL